MMSSSSPSKISEGSLEIVRASGDITDTRLAPRKVSRKRNKKVKRTKTAVTSRTTSTKKFVLVRKVLSLVPCLRERRKHVILNTGRKTSKIDKAQIETSSKSAHNTPTKASKITIKSSSSPSVISEESLEIVRATAPVVKENALKITSIFYPKMLSKHPEMFKYFNESNQRTGRQRCPFSEVLSGEEPSKDQVMASAQSKTLADAIIAYALNIDKLENLSETVDRIAQKHCALGVQPEDYQVVHDNLMEAIGEVLGSAVTAKVAAAWSEAVMALAKILIGVEKGLYEESAKNQWVGPRAFVVSNVEDETPLIRSVRFTPANGGGTCPFTPGQYISVYEKPAGKEYFAPRHYTVTSQPGVDPYYQISVKRLVDPASPDDESHNGVISNFVHGLKVGDTVKLGPVFGPKLLAAGDPSRTAAFVTVGVGITPTVAMLPTAIEERPRVAVFHADMDGMNHAFRQHIEECLSSSDTGGILSYYYSCPTDDDTKSPHYTEGRMTADKIVDTLKANGIDAERGTDYYICCGPKATRPIVEDLVEKLGVKKDRIHMEYFGPFVSVL